MSNVEAALLFLAGTIARPTYPCVGNPSGSVDEQAISAPADAQEHTHRELETRLRDSRALFEFIPGPIVIRYSLVSYEDSA